MKIMGLKEWVHRSSWLLTSLLLFFWIALSTTWMSHAFLPKSNQILLFFYFFLFGLSAIFLCFVIASFFSNAKRAAIVGPVTLESLLLPTYIFYSTNSNQAVKSKIAASLLSPTCFALGANIISDAEYANIGVQWTNLDTEGYNFGTCLGMLMVDTVIYALLAWYLDTVWKHDTGISKHPLYFLEPKYWCGERIGGKFNQCLLNCCRCLCCFGTSAAAVSDNTSSGNSASNTNNTNNANNTNNEIEMSTSNRPAITNGENSEEVAPAAVISDSICDYCDNENFEPIPENLRGNIRMTLQNLKKVYPDGKAAVRGISLDVLEGQITCLLGHNGAGKSTIISMITGMTSVSSGDVRIYGHQLSSEINTVRTLTGICPQQNIIFPTLTVREHLNYFGNLKGKLQWSMY
jgi:ATP-binding cassette subfamily A (ABC1) protein 3